MASTRSAVSTRSASFGKDEVVPPTTAEEKRKAKGPILLFVGPPGVGKTSVAKSIARSMGREYVRISLGGVRDEADIRGHRRTYVGAMPGRIIQGMRQAGTKNPVFLLDEVDKLGVSYQGDPSSALLEVLDPAQNDSFTDHYLGVPFDLSEVLFIATANFIQNIPGPLLDRMEVVEFSGYTEREKLAIAQRYLVPRQLKENGLKAEQIDISDAALAEVITGYTRESGVRQLERELGKLGRKVARKVAAREVERVDVDADKVHELLGRPKVHPERASREDQVGVATGMYYTPMGGDIMFVEVSTMKGKGDLVLTGQLGDVMKESARAAWSYARSHAESLGIARRVLRPRPARPRAGGRHPEGWSLGGRRDGDRHGLRPLRPQGEARPRDDRRDHPLRPRAADRRRQGEGARRRAQPASPRSCCRRTTRPISTICRSEVRDTLKIHLAEDLGDALALTLRGASYREGRLRFETPLEDGTFASIPH